MSPESFLDCPPPKYQSYGWLSPRVSYSREFPAKPKSTNTAGPKHSSLLPATLDKCAVEDKLENSDPDVSAKDVGDFEFCLDDPVIMLPADELFSDGKLLPLQLSIIRPVATFAASSLQKAPRCSSRWKELLVRGVSVDSPYMNSSGKIIFHSLERSSSSLSSFNGGSRYKHIGMERSYSTNIRVTSVLNVPVCSLRGSSKSGVFGFSLFSSSQPKKESGNFGSGNGGGSKGHQSIAKHRTNRIKE